MKEEENIYELIDQYLAGAMEEGHEFIDQVKKDPELSAEIALQSIVRKAVIHKRLMEVSHELHAFRTSNPTPKKKPWILPASVLVLLAISAGIFFITGIDKNKDKEVSGKMRETKQNTLFLDENHHSIPDTTPIIRKHSFALRPSSLPEEELQKINVPATSGPLSFPISSDSTALHLIQGTNMEAPVGAVEKGTIPSPTVIKIVKDDTFTRPCDTTHIAAEITKVLPCEKSTNGRLQLEKLIGGAMPYTFSIDGGQHFQAEKFFENLGPGNYEVQVKDRNNCLGIIDKNLVLPARICPEINSFVIDPLKESWDIPSDLQKSGKITIYDKSGQVVYTKTFGVMEHLTWNGTSENGETLRPGYYIYTIEQTNGVLRQGSVTLSY